MSRAGRGQILVVVDDEELRHLAGALMETTDAEVVEVETAVEALDHMQRCGHLVNVVFCDFRSDRGGRDLAREMRMRWPGVSRILLSITDPVEASPLPPDVMTLAKDWRALDLLKAADVYGHA